MKKIDCFIPYAGKEQAEKQYKDCRLQVSLETSV